MGRRSTRRHRASVSAELARTKWLAASLEPRRYFTREQAEAALVYLRPVVDDLRVAFRTAVECHCRLQCAVIAEHVARLEGEQARAIAGFDRALDEIELAGAALLDCWTCALAFPTRIEGGPQHLIWSPHEAEVWRTTTLAQFARDQRAALINRC